MSSLSIFLGLSALLAFVFAGRAFFGLQNVRNDAQGDYQYKLNSSMIDARLSEAGYKRAYVRFYSPRKHMFTSAAFAAVALLTLPALGLIRYILIYIWEIGGRSDDIQPGFLVFNLLLMVGILIFWSSIFFICARLYYRGAPVSLRDEMLKERD